MSKPPDNVIELSPTLSLSEYTDSRHGSFGFWLWDDIRGMNLAMRAKTERAAFVKALLYYQNRLVKVEEERNTLSSKVNSFLSQFTDEDC